MQSHGRIALALFVSIALLTSGCGGGSGGSNGGGRYARNHFCYGGLFSRFDQYESNVNLHADGQRDWKLQFIGHMVRQPREHWRGQQRRRLYSGWCGDGDHHRNVNGGFDQIRQCNGDGDRSVHNHFSFCGLYPGRYPYHADIYLHGNRAGNRIV